MSGDHSQTQRPERKERIKRKEEWLVENYRGFCISVGCLFVCLSPQRQREPSFWLTRSWVFDAPNWVKEGGGISRHGSCNARKLRCPYHRFTKCSFAQQIREYKIITPFPFYLRSGSLSLPHKVRLPLEPTNLFSFL